MMLAAEKIRLQYGKQIIIEEMDFCLRSSEIVSIIGPNGSGKSTLLKALGRLLKPTAGLVALDERDVGAMMPTEFAKTVAIVPQAAQFPEDMTVLDLASYGRTPHHGATGAEDRRAVEAALEAVGMSEMRFRRLDALSGGECQRARIALALAQDPRILLLDEPTTYLDIRHQLDLMHLIRRLQREWSLAVVMVLHDLNHAARFSDRLVAVKDGAIFAAGKVEEVFTEEVLRALYEIEPHIVQIRQGDRDYPACFPREMQPIL